jgi:hypothetical protein
MRTIGLAGALLGVALQTSGAPESVKRIAGVDAGSGIAYVLISMDGRLVGAEPVSGAAPPRLTAQCTRTAEGKPRLEMLADFGGVESIAYMAPWKPTAKYPNRPILVKPQITMEFLGYTKVKPLKRQWESIPGLTGEWMYATPGFHSGNMEDVTYYLQFLRALPTLRMTLPGHGAAEWETTKWQQALHEEPMCAASGA